MSGQLYFIKDPDAKLDYRIEWEQWLETSDIITASEWIVPAGITRISSSFDDDSTIIWLSGGTVGETYELVNRITTFLGRIDDRTLRIKIEQK